MKKESNSALGLKWELETGGGGGGSLLKNSSLRGKNAACLEAGRQAQPLGEL